MAKIKCDRCYKIVDGDIKISPIGEKITTGFYDVHSGYWARFAKSWNEKMICDQCMHNDLNYRSIYDYKFSNRWFKNS